MTSFFSKIKSRDIWIAVALSIPLILVLFFLQTQTAEAAGLGQRIANSIISGLSAALKGFVGLLLQLFGWIIGLFSGLLLTLAGQFLDIAISFSLDSRNISGVTGIILGWGIFRDLVNMLFIFILLYIGIATIIQAGSFGTKKILANLIIVALFVNFSFFLTGFVIDIGNVSAGAIYSGITPSGVSAANVNFTAGVGGQFIQNLSLTQLKNQVADAPNSLIGDDAIKNGIMSIMNAIFYFVAAFTLFMGGFLFIVRHVVLVFVIILSPLAFAAYILPNTQKHWRAWLGQLMGATFVAPIYLLLISIVLAISASDVFTTAPANISTGGEVASSLLDSPGLIMNYLIIIGLLIASYTVSKNMSSSIASISGKWAGKITGAGTGLAAGGAGFAYRNSMGRLAQKASESDSFKRRAAAGGFSGWANRAMLRTSNSAATANGDIRGIKSVGTGASLLGEKLGTKINVGQAKQGGIRRDIEARKQRQVDKEKRIVEVLGYDNAAVQGIRDDIGEYNENTRTGTGLIGDLQTQKEKLEQDKHDLRGLRSSGAPTADIKAQEQRVKETREEISDVNRKIQDKKDSIDAEKRRPGIEYAKSVGGERVAPTTPGGAATHKGGRGRLASLFHFRTRGRNREIGARLKEELRNKKV